MTKFALLVPLAACMSGPSDVVGPFTGDTHRFAVDRIILPTTSSDARSVGDDLDGDGAIDNQLGIILTSLASEHDVSTHAADMIASGVIASFVEIQADRLVDDDTAAVTYLGADGEPATSAAGRLSSGSFRSNRTATTRAPGRAIIHLPVLADADPIAVPFEGLEIDLRPDGNGGYDGWIRGGIPGDAAATAGNAAIAQMIANNPQDHILLEHILDRDANGRITHDEIATNQLVASLIAPDIQLFQDGEFAPTVDHPQPDSVSAAFTIHLSRCDTGACTLATPQDLCHDRVLDGDETDVDCGGTCGACADGAVCQVPTDCQSGGCDAGRCRASTCSDGVRDQLESDVDCGWGCGKCAAGKRCNANIDCESNVCGGEIEAPTCLPAAN